MLGKAYAAPSLVALLAAVLIGFVAGRWGGPSSSVFGGRKLVQVSLNTPRQAIFDELSAAETRAVAAYVIGEMPNVKTSMWGGAGPDGDYITGTSAVELIPPPKAAALAYVDGESNTPPPRYARVTIARGSKIDVMEYRVGPIVGGKVEKGSPIVPLVEEGTIPFEKRPMDLGDTTPLLVADQAFPELKDLLIESFGPVWADSMFPGCGSECFSGKAGQLYPFAFNDISSTTKERISKIAFFWYMDQTNFQAIWLHGLPFSFRVSQKGTDVSDWRVFDFFYCGKGPFPSAKALLASIREEDKCTYKPDPYNEGKRGSWDIPGATKDAPDDAHSLLRPVHMPSETSKIGSYSLQGAPNGDGRQVKWQGWEFFTAMRPSTGLAAMDVKFKGTRIAYELALSEAAAHYSGTGADQVFYLDGAFSMSQLGGDIKPGIDCPSHATFVDGALWVEQHPETPEVDMDSDVAKARPYKAFCIFEEASGSASHWRHLQHATKKVDGVPTSSLIVRAVTAVGNYDYITEFKFGLDGSIRVNFDFAGYMETRWFSQKTTPWERSLGEIVHKNVAAPLHSHFGCFKVDLDSPTGKGESLETTRITAGMKSDVPNLMGWATKYVERNYATKEGVGLSTFVPSAATPTGFAIVDGVGSLALDDATPTAPPGYMIVPGPTVAQTLPDDHPFVLASAFSKYTLAVTKRKEEERRATAVYDLFGPGEPYTSLDSFLDGESIEQTDLVAWVSLGKEHVPRTEDLPLISNFGTYFDLIPRNIHSVNAAMDVYVGED